MIEKLKVVVNIRDRNKNKVIIEKYESVDEALKSLHNEKPAKILRKDNIIVILVDKKNWG